MKVTSTEAARRFSQLLDRVEHEHASFVVERHGRAIATISPVSGADGARVKAMLRSHRVDDDWARDLHEVRSLAATEDRSWHD